MAYFIYSILYNAHHKIHGADSALPSVSGQNVGPVTLETSFWKDIQLKCELKGQGEFCSVNLSPIKSHQLKLDKHVITQQPNIANN